jgi:hypothetical protein
MAPFAKVALAIEAMAIEAIRFSQRWRHFSFA